LAPIPNPQSPIPNPQSLKDIILIYMLSRYTLKLTSMLMDSHKLAALNTFKHNKKFKEIIGSIKETVNG
jgi:hypothetical protein